MTAATEYWRKRKHLRYYGSVQGVCAAAAACGAQTWLDVGNAGCLYQLDVPGFRERVALDRDRYPDVDGLEIVTADVREWNPSRLFDVVTCLQMLEHVPDPAAICQKLRSLCCDVLVLCVPYRWPAGQDVSHTWDPIDADTLDGWVGMGARARFVVREDRHTAEYSGERLIAVYAAQDWET